MELLGANDHLSAVDRLLDAGPKVGERQLPVGPEVKLVACA